MKNMIEILRKQTFPAERIPALEQILRVAKTKSPSPEYWLAYAYDLGRIDGIRQERARRKK